MSDDLPLLRSPETDGDPRASFADRIREADSLFVTTDFDGTVAGIREDPDAATIREDARAALERLATDCRTDVAVVSGRAVEDVRDRVGLDGVAYAGNHGMEIETADRRFVHPEAEAASDAVSRACDELRDAFDGVDGLLVEDKDLTATVHYRTVEDETIVERIRSTARSVADRIDALRAHDGKQIVELRPTVDWDKGRAVSWLLDSVATAEEPHPVYLGDDVTDEAAFRAIADSGTAIAVGADADETAAGWIVDDPAGVAALLDWIADARRVPSDGP